MHSHPSIATLSVAVLCIRVGALLALGRTADKDLPSTLPQTDKEAGWRLLFDGRNPDQWRGFGQVDFPTNRWNAEDGCLHLLPHVGSGDLVSKEKFTDFEFAWEWRISFGGNSGVKYLINEEHGPIGPEYQMIDDLQEEDGSRGPKYVTGSLADRRHVEAAKGWCALHDFTEAAAELEQVTALAHNHPDVLEARWQLCANTDQWEEALALATGCSGIKAMPMAGSQ